MDVESFWDARRFDDNWRADLFKRVLARLAPQGLKAGLSADLTAGSSQLMHWRSVRPEMVTTGTNRFPHFGQCVIRSMRSPPNYRRKISSILIRNTVVPIAIRTTPGSCLAIEGVKSPKTPSWYEYHPPARSKTVRTAVGRSIFPAGGIGRTSKPAAGEGEPADRPA
jgi:hypothetical protein